MLVRILLFLISFQVFGFSNQKAEIQTQIIDTGDYLHIYYVNKTKKPVIVNTFFSLNSCSDKVGFCIEGLNYTDDFYFHDGGISHGKTTLREFQIYGYLIEKKHLPFKERDLLKKPSYVTFKFFLPNGDVVVSDICSFKSFVDTFEFNCQVEQ